MSADALQLLAIGFSVLALALNAWTSFRLWQNNHQHVSPWECFPEFRLDAFKSAAEQHAFESIGGRRRDLGDPKEEWDVVCRCGRHDRCPWFQAAQQLSLNVGAAVDRHLLYQVTSGGQHANGLDSHWHAAGIYHLTPKAWLLGPLGFVVAALDSDSPSTPPVVGPSVEHTERSAQHRNS